jgi:hypothetical protein
MPHPYTKHNAVPSQILQQQQQQQLWPAWQALLDVGCCPLAWAEAT